MFYKSVFIIIASTSSCFGMQSEKPKEKLSQFAVQEELAPLRKMEEQDLPIYSSQLAPEGLEAIHAKWDKVAEKTKAQMKKNKAHLFIDPIVINTRNGNPAIAEELFEKRNRFDKEDENLITFIADEDQTGQISLLKKTLETIQSHSPDMSQYLSEETMKKVVYRGTPAIVEEFLRHWEPNDMLFRALDAAKTRKNLVETIINRRDWDTRFTFKDLQERLQDADLTLKIVEAEHKKRLTEHWAELEREALFSQLPENPYDIEKEIQSSPQQSLLPKGKSKIHPKDEENIKKIHSIVTLIANSLFPTQKLSSQDNYQKKGAAPSSSYIAK